MRRAVAREGGDSIDSDVGALASEVGRARDGELLAKGRRRVGCAAGAVVGILAGYCLVQALALGWWNLD